MQISKDLRSAKQVMSGRLLRLGLQGGVVGLMPTLSVHAAMATAGRNVHAVGIGRKLVEGGRTSQVCIRIHVVQKIAPSLLAPRDMIPKEIDGIPTDVVESPPAFMLPAKDRTAAPKGRKKKGGKPRTATCSKNKQTRQRPMVAGISAAHHDVTAGTISYFCHSTRAGDDPAAVHILSNNHVFADVNNAAIGDDLYQPGPADGGTAPDHMADLHRYVPIVLDGSTPNRADAAIGELRPDATYKAEICMIGALDGTERATVGTPVRKHGRTTGYTEGEVSDDAYDALVGMDHQDPNIVGLFEDQLRIEVSPPHRAIGLGGDSGSMVVHRDRPRAVGLYFAGPGSGSYGVANHIEDVLNELEISLL